MNPFFEAFKKAPGHLKFISILSLMNIGYSLVANIQNMMRGPLSKSEVKELKAAVYSQASAAEEMGGEAADFMIDLMDKMARMVDYTNANFTLNYLSSMAILFIGLAGVILMINRKVAGFHLYIIYSLASVAQVYLIAPAKDVPTFMITANLILCSIFVLMYARHHSWLQNASSDETI